jgi:hypothetical protein
MGAAVQLRCCVPGKCAAADSRRGAHATSLGPTPCERPWQTLLEAEGPPLAPRQRGKAGHTRAPLVRSAPARLPARARLRFKDAQALQCRPEPRGAAQCPLSGSPATLILAPDAEQRQERALPGRERNEASRRPHVQSRK